ncbi:4-hydroxybenzoate octaprenyltransferase [Martelella lutilitoris]|uniref:4-hydroxybenzoate octaprenyltransferase n=1 Tax=Martelella lutilitoris TaxID=2583532 RepID=A0A5C4JVP2_9HYPH|nr:4-hydroxybenzoate octaprenyltransferase [Martelella lutilitoris]TNB49426.1 4-hydroxybenzoate octaprenyltransferase [Martelella lutilitoris]
MGTTTEDNGRVFDAPSDNFVYSLLPRWLWPYAQLARWDRPIGWQLLMWPCFWSAAMAAAVTAEANAFRPGQFIAHLLLFFIGAVAMRGAGCTYNDLVDHDIDNQVARTRSRPLPSGRVTRRQAKIFILAQALTGLAVLLSFNVFTILLGFASLAFVAIYPFAKRFTDWPQLFLGLAFSWGGLVGWAAVFGSLSLPAMLVYLAAIVWTIGYDTIYAHQDKEDDALIGVRSTALLFGEKTKPWLVLFYAAMLALLVAACLVAGLGWAAFAGLLAAGVMLFYQIAVLDIDDGAQCLKLFKFNSRVGLVVFLGLVAAIFIG